DQRKSLLLIDALTDKATILHEIKRTSMSKVSMEADHLITFECKKNILRLRSRSKAEAEDLYRVLIYGSRAAESLEISSLMPNRRSKEADKARNMEANVQNANEIKERHLNGLIFYNRVIGRLRSSSSGPDKLENIFSSASADLI
ncbi:hypothetical protein PENTCL1PPCAC_7898, partial [Pristionchus entomophagus]